MAGLICLHKNGILETPPRRAGLSPMKFFWNKYFYNKTENPSSPYRAYTICFCILYFTCSIITLIIFLVHDVNGPCHVSGIFFTLKGE
jgi:hypothetical protein